MRWTAGMTTHRPTPPTPVDLARRRASAASAGRARLVVGEPVGPAGFDPAAGWFDGRLVHVRRLPPGAGPRLLGDLARLPPREELLRPLAVVGSGPATFAVLDPPTAVPLLALVRRWRRPDERDRHGGRVEDDGLDGPGLRVLLHGLAAALVPMHARGIAAGWLGPESVLVDATGRPRLDLALSIGHRRPEASPADDAVALGVLAGWIARELDIEVGAAVGLLLDEVLVGRDRVPVRVGAGQAVLAHPGTDGPSVDDVTASWLARLLDATARDVGTRPVAVPSWVDPRTRLLLDAVGDRRAATALASPDRPRGGRLGWGVLSRGRLGPRRRSWGR
ncbi:hypothetical protein EDD28_3144 [Salana multivorans]|uniref:Uncharacterized protein n=2 Tax=Salana multivorans TaxID=120377 RepID=A0A3N2D1S4_9MICO|nr:hypothetical protein EDD28_3144 [Salana multivorans]